MSLKITLEEFNKLRTFLEKATGISLANDKSYLVESRLGEIMSQHHFTSFGQFFEFTEQKCETCEKFKAMLVDAMTTNETTWFRDEHPFVALKENLLPKLVEELTQNRRLKVRIWCAASSTGQEPYSIAIIIHEFLKNHPALNPLAFDILATDISTLVLDTALKGKYDALAMSRGMPKDLLAKFFTPIDKEWIIHDSIRKMVSFKKFNLVDSFQELPHFDIIFLRNVAIYFDDEFKRKLFAKMAQKLVPAGYLFLGSAESLWGFSEDYEKQTHKQCVFYKVKNPLVKV